MATFTSFLEILPDPDNKIGNAGQSDASGTAGPGLASVNLSRPINIEKDDTIGGLTVLRTNNAGLWQVNLTYNPLTQTQFAPVYTFLMQKRNSLRSFYISLPQYKVPKDSNFAIYTASNPIYTTESGLAGRTYLEIEDTSSSDGTTLPSFGDLFYFSDTNDSLHTKAYMISRVETQTDYQTGNQPSVGSIRIHFSPGLNRAVASGAEIVFYNPLIKVRQLGNTQEYNLDNDGLYIFNVKLQEAFY